MNLKNWDTFGPIPWDEYYSDPPVKPEQFDPMKTWPCARCQEHSGHACMRSLSAGSPAECLRYFSWVQSVWQELRRQIAGPDWVAKEHERRMTPAEFKILDCLRTYGPQSVAEVAAAVGFTDHSLTRRYLYRLQSNNLAHVVGRRQSKGRGGISAIWDAI